MRAGEEEVVSGLVREVFDRFVAPLYEPRGREEFARYIDPAGLRERSRGRHLVFLAAPDDDPRQLLGVMELRDCEHVCLLFVRGPRQRGGVGRALVRQAAALARARGHGRLTVNASPNAVPAYESFGFRAEGGGEGAERHPVPPHEPAPGGGGGGRMRKRRDVLPLRNEVEARRLSAVLQEEGIPHLIKSYGDRASPGVQQVRLGWGHLEAAPADLARIRAIYRDLTGPPRPSGPTGAGCGG